MRFIDREEVSRPLTCEVCIPIVRETMIAPLAGETMQHLRMGLPLSDGRLFGIHAKAAGLMDDSHIAAEIGEMLSGKVEGRRNLDEITLHKSLGHLVQDLSTAWHLYPTLIA